MDSVAFNIGGLVIYWYGVLVTSGFVAGLWSASRRAPLSGVSRDAIVDLGPWIMAGAVIGARLLHVISYWDEEFARAPWHEVFNLRKGGLVFYGGLAGSSLAVIIAARRRKLPLWTLADILAPSIALGQVFGRLGCLFNGCCFGCATKAPWGLYYPWPHQSYGHAVHPTQIYESLLCLCLYAFLALRFRKPHFKGQIFSLYLLFYGVIRFTVEFFRGDYDRHYLGGWATPGHLVSLLVIASGVALWNVMSRSSAATPPAPHA